MSMTVVQLFHRIGRRARGGDFTKLSLTEQTDIADAANRALFRLYNALPPYFKEQKQGFLLPAPVSIATGVTQYSTAVTPGTFTAAQIGQTVVLDGDSAWNQILDTGALLNPYMGQSGAVSGTVYGNAVYSTTVPFDRVIGNPEFADQNLVPILNAQMGRVNGQVTGWLLNKTIGQPQAWWPQLMGQAQGKSPFLVLRFAPAPDRAYAINIRLGYWPKRLAMADYDSATNLVVPDQFIESSLVPMAIEEFMNSPAYEHKGDEEMLAQRGERGENFARSQPGLVAAPSNRIYTPLGY